MNNKRSRPVTTLRNECGPFKAVGEHCLKTPVRRMTPKSDFLVKLEQRQRQGRRRRKAPSASA
jgi:hypothetical protein